MVIKQDLMPSWTFIRTNYVEYLIPCSRKKKLVFDDIIILKGDNFWHRNRFEAMKNYLEIE